MTKAKTTTTSKRSSVPAVIEQYLRVFEGDAGPIDQIFHAHAQVSIDHTSTAIGAEEIAVHLKSLQATLGHGKVALQRCVTYVEPVDGTLTLMKVDFAVTPERGTPAYSDIGMYHVRDGLIVRASELHWCGQARVGADNAR